MLTIEAKNWKLDNLYFLKQIVENQIFFQLSLLHCLKLNSLAHMLTIEAKNWKLDNLYFLKQTVENQIFFQLSLL
jgi:hypothetical protein